MSVRIGAVASAAALLVASLAQAPSANALTEWDYCGDGGDTLAAGTAYVAQGTGWYVSKHSMTISGNSANLNNLAARLRHSTNAPVYWSWNKSNAVGGTTYSPTPQVNVPHSSEFYTQAIFDQNGGDPRCYTLIQLDGVDQS